MRRILVSVIRSNIKFHENGKLKYKCMIVNGKIHADEYWFYKNGIIESISTYVNDKLHGDVVWFHEDGNLRCKDTYKNDKLIKKPMCIVL